MKYASESSIDMSLCLACEYSCFSLLLANRDISPFVATQVQQFNRIGVATTVGRRGRIGCDSAGKILIQHFAGEILKIQDKPVRNHNKINR